MPIRGACSTTVPPIALSATASSVKPLQREALASGEKTTDAVARERGLSPKYLGGLSGVLANGAPSPLLENLRRHD